VTLFLGYKVHTCRSGGSTGRGSCSTDLQDARRLRLDRKIVGLERKVRCGNTSQGADRKASVAVGCQDFFKDQDNASGTKMFRRGDVEASDEVVTSGGATKNCQSAWGRVEEDYASIVEDPRQEDY